MAKMTAKSFKEVWDLTNTSIVSSKTLLIRDVLFQLFIKTPYDTGTLVNNWKVNYHRTDEKLEYRHSNNYRRPTMPDLGPFVGQKAHIFNNSEYLNIVNDNPDSSYESGESYFHFVQTAVKTAVNNYNTPQMRVTKLLARLKELENA